MSKKENLEKKEAMREIKDNEVENVSGGWVKHGDDYIVLAAPREKGAGGAIGVFKKKDEAINYENNLKNNKNYDVVSYYSNVNGPVDNYWRH